MKIKLTLEKLQEEAKIFSELESEHDETSIYGSTDGKAVGTYLEHKFKDFLRQKYDFDSGNSASGIDLPELEVDIKTTSIIQPQSSCPFKSARQKIFGLGYNLLVFVYKKEDNQQTKTSRLYILHTIFVSKNRTADYQLTTSLNKILENNANKDDIKTNEDYSATEDTYNVDSFEIGDTFETDEDFASYLLGETKEQPIVCVRVLEIIPDKEEKSISKKTKKSSKIDNKK